ncbi:AbrB family transcriptional regulator [Streptomyces sp. G-G2]|uniref:AbrB family transcriptional regulator n=1 Tax=Streptomyces sp. G-G2 TaxID=3046201 RepID=UPI0024BAC56A|nr:AbrB family transcriptional regulator [Streptomyces sp. G-G2]MDJ0386156.1 AbrB family transcriptional regulator [Streptomyces sp. G-G2]
MAGLAVAAAAFGAGKLPVQMNRVFQVALGVLMGSYLSSRTLPQPPGHVLPLTAVTAATVALSLAEAAFLSRLGRVDRASAVLGMVVGGSAAVVSCAEGQGADPRQVAFMQVPAGGSASSPPPLRRSCTGWSCTGWSRPRRQRPRRLATRGPDIGLRFARPTLAPDGPPAAARAGPDLAVSAACGAPAWLLAATEHVPFLDASWPPPRAESTPPSPRQWPLTRTSP